MGYPDWTLLGMGLSLLGALVALAFALLGQSPGMLQRLGLGGARLDLRVRTFTSYAFALLLLSIGFFLAGIPVDSQGNEAELADESPVTASAEDSSTTSLDSLSEETGMVESDGALAIEANPTEASSPESGSFSGPPSSIPTATSSTSGDSNTDAEDDAQSPGDIDSPVAQSTATPRPSSTPTTVPTPSPTATSFPTITPTPISGETALVSTGGSTIWIVRSPGGQNLTLVRDGDTVLLSSGHANQAGLLWREIRTVTGILGWIQEIYLDYGE